MAASPEIDPSKIHECAQRREVVGSERARQPSPPEWGESITAVLELNQSWWAVAGSPPEYPWSLDLATIDLKRFFRRGNQACTERSLLPGRH